AVAGRADVVAAEVSAVGGAGAAGAAGRRHAGAGAGLPGRRLADRRRPVDSVGLALRIARARAARIGGAGAADEARVRRLAVRAGAVTVAELADPLVADVAGAIRGVGHALRVRRTRAAGVGLRDAAQLAGGAIDRLAVAVAREAGPGEADRGDAVGVVGLAGGVAAARLAEVRRLVAQLAAPRAVAGGVAVAAHAGVAHADVLRAVGAHAGVVVGAWRAGMGVGVADLAAAAVGADAAVAADAGAV